MPRYDWSAVQKYYNLGHSRAECIQHFGFSPKAWTDAKRSGKLKTRSYQRTALVHAATSKSRGSVRKRLLQEGLLREVCYECGITHWFGEKLSLHLDHIDGVGDNNRIGNLRMLCPNCHSQTATFSGRNVKKTT